MGDRIDELKELAASLTAIPANEQFLGHLKVAVQKALFLIAEELEYLRGSRAEEFERLWAERESQGGEAGSR